MRATYLLLAALLVNSSPVLAQPSALEQARIARFDGRIDDAERLLNVALRADPNNYIGLYNMGLVYEARAVRAPAGESRRGYSRTAAAWLERAYKSPGRGAAGEDGYNIYNSLGAMYLGVGDLNRANFYLQQGLKNQDRLDNSSKGRLYANVGYLYALQGDTLRARQYFELGSRLGSSFAKENLSRFNRAVRR